MDPESIDQLWKEAVGGEGNYPREASTREIAKKLWIKKKRRLCTRKNGPKEYIFTDYPGIAWHSFKGRLESS